MSRSLFDELRARKDRTPAPPRLKPNIHARVAHFAWQKAALVVSLWLFVALASTVMLWRSFIEPTTTNLALSISDTSTSQSASAFAALENMQTITLSGSNPDLLDNQRDELVDTMRKREDLYQLVFAPGSGDFYQDNGLLYRSLDEIKGRVAYALSLKPLFTAISAAPNTNSMATLVSGIAGAIQQGRAPQGLDDFLAESANSVQALMRGEDKPIDWSALADLDNVNTDQVLRVLAVPKSGQEAAAREFTLKSLAQVQAASEITANLSQAEMPSPPKFVTVTINWAGTVAATAIGIILLAVLLAFALGRCRLLLVIFLPSLLITPSIGLALMFVDGAEWLALWPLGFGLLWLMMTLSLHAVFSKVTYAAGVKAREVRVMLADQHHGQEVIWLWLVLAMPFAGLMALSNGARIAALALLLAVLCLSMVLTLPTALLRFIPEALQWRAAAWIVPAHRALFETGQWQGLGRVLGSGLVLVCIAYLALAPPRIEVPQPDVPASVIVANSSDAEIAIKRLNAFTEAKAVRWLGMFMPSDADAKRTELHQLSGQFPRITPVQSQPPVLIREQLKSLQNSLRKITTIPQTQLQLKRAADDFRRSLALLSATSGDEQVRQLENRLFGGFNRLADRADILSNLPLPQMSNLPDELHKIFGKPEGPMRIEVTPAEGISNAQVATKLEQAGFDVLHPSVARDQAIRSANLLVAKVLGAASVASLIILVIGFFRRPKSVITALVMAVAAGIIVAAGGRYWQLDWSLTNLLQAICVISAIAGFVWLATVQTSGKAISTLELFLLPAMAAALVLPFIALNIAPVTTALAPIVSALFAAALMVGLSRQHQ